MAACANHTPAFSPPSPDATATVGQRLGSVACALVVSLLILIGMARAQKTSIPAPPAPTEELRALSLEAPPPPPPTIARESATPPVMIELEPQPVADGIVIAAVVRPQELQVPVVAQHPFELDMSAYQPRAIDEAREVNRVYQTAEVDQRPVVLYRKMPNVTVSMLEQVKNPRVILLFVVNIDGAVENIHIVRTPNEEFGRVMVEAVREWRFKPAMKAGRQVRCLVQLPIFVRSPSRNPFTAD